VQLAAAAAPSQESVPQTHEIIHCYLTGSTKIQDMQYEYKQGLYRIGIGPELTQIRCSFVCHCESAKGGRGNLKL